MKLEDLPDGARVFVDANILIYHFSGISVECRAFLQRCEVKQVEAFTGVHILLEVTHRLMVLEAVWSVRRSTPRIWTIYLANYSKRPTCGA
jgi:predicted nucleic acid-binding protein